MSLMFKQSDRWVFPPIYGTPAVKADLLSVQGKNTGEHRRGRFVTPILLVSATYGGQVGSMHIAHVST